MKHMSAVIVSAVLLTGAARAEIATIEVVSGSGASVSLTAPGSPLGMLDLADSGDTVLNVELSNSTGAEYLFLRVEEPAPFEGLNLEIGSVIDGEFVLSGPAFLVNADYDGDVGTPTATGFTFGPLTAEGTIGLIVAGPPGLDGFALRLSPRFTVVPEPAAGSLLLLAFVSWRPRRD